MSYKHWTFISCAWLAAVASGDVRLCPPACQLHQLGVSGFLDKQEFMDD